MNKLKTAITFALMLCASITFSQEVAPLKTFKYTIGVDHLKTEQQANNIANKVNKIKGINNASLVLIDYKLIFECTNHNMEKNSVMDIVKQIILEEGVNLTTINRQIIKQDEKNK